MRAVMLMCSFAPSFNGSEHSVVVRKLIRQLGKQITQVRKYNHPFTYKLTVLDSIIPVDSGRQVTDGPPIPPGGRISSLELLPRLKQLFSPRMILTPIGSPFSSTYNEGNRRDFAPGTLYSDRDNGVNYASSNRNFIAEADG
jgi:hypothetical protein